MLGLEREGIMRNDSDANEQFLWLRGPRGVILLVGGSRGYITLALTSFT